MKKSGPIAAGVWAKRSETEVIERVRDIVLASNFDGVSVGAERPLESPRSADQGLGGRDGARGGAEPVGALGIQELRVCAGECRGGELERVVECGEDGELGCVVEIVGCRDPIEGPGCRRVSPGHVRVFFGRRASASRCR